jgi:DNA (cytosine-5)-methyltransferase 1
MAGFRVLWASEFIPAAQVVYELNHPNSHLDKRDIRDVAPEDILETTGKERGEIDVLDGSPPCSDFSTAGSRESGWGKVKEYSDTKQRVDDLFFEYARILDGLQPKVFVAENVDGLVKGKAKGYFKHILRELKGCGYNVSARVLDAQFLGVPQRRKRLIFVGVRNDLQAEPTHPKPFPYTYSTKEACPNIEWVKHGGKPNNWKRATSPHPTLTQMKVSPTGYLSGGQYVSESHPSKHVRELSLNEMRRIQGFPKDFELKGTPDQRWERLARTVPPIMMREIAATIRDEILTNQHE